MSAFVAAPRRSNSGTASISGRPEGCPLEPQPGAKFESTRTVMMAQECRHRRRWIAIDPISERLLVVTLRLWRADAFPALNGQLRAIHELVDVIREELHATIGKRGLRSTRMTAAHCVAPQAIAAGTLALQIRIAQ